MKTSKNLLKETKIRKAISKVYESFSGVQYQSLTPEEAQRLIDIELRPQKWKLKIITSGGGLCLHRKNEIWVDRNNLNIPFVLHEIAHAKLPKEIGHDVFFADILTHLCIRYLGFITIKDLRDSERVAQTREMESLKQIDYDLKKIYKPIPKRK